MCERTIVYVWVHVWVHEWVHEWVRRMGVLFSRYISYVTMCTLLYIVSVDDVIAVTS